MTQDGTTALMAASVRGHKDVVDALLRHDANVDQQNLDGHTALMFAYNGRNQVNRTRNLSLNHWQKRLRRWARLSR